MKRVVDKLLHPHTQAPSIREVHSSDTYSFPSETKVQTVQTNAPADINAQYMKKNSDTVRDSSGMVVNKRVSAITEEEIIRPPVIQETRRAEEVIEVQPVIHRLIEIPEVHHIEKHIYEKVLPTGPSVITKEPIVEVTVQPHIIEDVQTIIHREVPKPYFVHEEQHVNEVVVRPTIYTKEVLNQGQTTWTDTSFATTTSGPALAPAIDIRTDTRAIPISTDTHLWEIAAPHEKSAVHPHHNTAEPTHKWVVAYPKAMEQGEGHRNTDSRHYEKTSVKQVEHKGSVKKSSDKSHNVEEKDTKDTQVTRESSDNNAHKNVDNSHHDHDHEKEKDVVKMRDVVINPALVEVNSPTAAHAKAGPSLEHPVFVERTVPHSSLDLRAQFSLERRADLTTAGSDLPSFSGHSYALQVDRGLDDLERGSRIGLEQLPKRNDEDKDKEKDKEKEGKDKTELRTSSSESKPKGTLRSSSSSSASSSHKTKAEEEPRKHQSASGKFTFPSAKPDA